MTIRNFINKYNVRIENEWTDSNPNMANSRNMNHWKTTLRMGRKQMSLVFSMGRALCNEPTQYDVLYCLHSDAYVDCYSFEEFCSEFGYDTDSRQAERTYKATVRQNKKLRQFMGELFDEFMECDE